jgi:hypothetical protein
VSFVVVDANSYRYVLEDTIPITLGPLRDLPGGVRFVPAGPVPEPSFRFARLGNVCVSCVFTLSAATGACTAAELAAGGRCADAAAGNYVQADLANGVMIVQLTEAVTQFQKTVRVSSGGRVLPQP